MRLSDFNYDLPPGSIAQRPLDQRDASRMLILDRARQDWEDSAFLSLPERLRGDELIVVNNARVIPARLFGRRAGIRAEKPGRNPRVVREFLSSEIEVLLTRQVSPEEWEALVRPGKKMQLGSALISERENLPAKWSAAANTGYAGFGSRPQATCTKRLNGSAIFRCLPTSRAATNQRTVSATRRSSPRGPGLSRRPLRGCIFHPRFLSRSSNVVLRSLRSRSMWVWAPSSRFMRRKSNNTRCTRNSTRFQCRRQKPFATRGAIPGLSLRWEQRWCEPSKMPLRNQSPSKVLIPATRVRISSSNRAVRRPA